MQETEKKQKYISYLHGRWFVSTLSLPVLFDTITDHLRSTNWGRSISKHQKQVETINQSINQQTINFKAGTTRNRKLTIEISNNLKMTNDKSPLKYRH